jgi:hypothetical protein
MKLAVFKNTTANQIQLCALVGLNYSNSTVMHGMENGKNHLKFQIEVGQEYIKLTFT